MKKFIYAICTIFFTMSILTSCSNKPIRLFAGTYTETGQKGLYLFDLSPEAGTFRLLSEADAGPNPSYFCVSKEKKLIYAADEAMEFNGIKGGGVTALKYTDETGAVEKVKDLLVPFGGPCFISLSPKEDFLLFASYSSSSIAIVKLDAKGLPETVTDTILFPLVDGKVSHPHMISFDPAGKKVYLTDLGLDRIVIYDFDAVSGHLKQIENGIVNLPAGAGPRHFVFNSAGTKMYVICELNSTISVFDVNLNGGLRPVQTLTTLGDGFSGESACADIHLGRGEKYLYGSNRGENTIVVFTIESDGNLALAGRIPCGGNWPRNFVIDPSGKFMLVGNQKSGDISLFEINQKTGIPEYKDDYKLITPACLKF
jgi:6-phosphogluconolactonase